MAIKTFEQCMSTIMDCIRQREHVNYADRLSVRRYNSAYDRSFRNMRYIDIHYSNKLDYVIELLRTSEPTVIGHCAPMFFRLENSTYAQKNAAISLIRWLIAENKLSPLEKLGFSESLKKWEAELAKEAES